MDTSEQYIKMCDWPEIQDKWEPGDGDWAYSIRDGASPIFPPTRYLGKLLGRLKDDFTFLPRQDQIQEWFDWRKYDVSVCWCAKPFKLEWSDDPMETFGVNGDSMEQLWLAFYMYEKHGKVWNGEEWVRRGE